MPATETPPAESATAKTYPYPLENDDDAANDYDDFRKVQEILIGHAQQLAVNVKPDDPDINRRSLALSHILDRIHQLDAMLPSLIPEQVMCWEFVYDGMVHNKPPCARTEEDLMAQLEIVRKRKEREARSETKRGPINM